MWGTKPSCHRFHTLKYLIFVIFSFWAFVSLLVFEAHSLFITLQTKNPPASRPPDLVQASSLISSIF